ncbi:Cyn operon transcriptional activator [Sebaldella termitidis]|uniref:Transcriptional regulator, LysR family n=1 Tax=Sebaldella termitidis (strain ATCC 33386 / NCTC 11300) TaxID=526218 RepID=D1AJE2_SEBTE|nr:LysR family transcriptional regulator [Sebaldella termitidis]ACZ08830.1 transcriptional regulator, LysR family [Sebaldella termitidis ATCC 33386]SUI24150.1 Cyn operon transcriptional activator [Sebaldella termitidis]
MELRVLKYFLAVAREKNITKASQILHITQPTLSRQLMELEEELGKTLFIRGKRKLILTDEGILLRKRAEEILELVEKTEKEIMSSDEIINGEIFIGGGESETMRLIGQISKKLQEKYPSICYHLFSGNADDVLEKLDKGLLDFGVLIAPVDIRKYEYIKFPKTDIWGLLMRKHSPLAKNKVIKPQDILDIPLICSRQTLVREDISKWIGKDINNLNVVSSYNLIYNASLMVEEGVGYALCLDKLINTTGDSALCYRPLEPRLEVEVYIVWKKSQIFSKTSKKFLEVLQMELLEEI